MTKEFEKQYGGMLDGAVDRAAALSAGKEFEVRGDLVPEAVWEDIDRNYRSVFGKEFNKRCAEAGAKDLGKQGKHGRKYRKLDGVVSPTTGERIK